MAIKLYTDLDWKNYWKSRAERAEELLRRIAKARVIFPSMCANNTEAYDINEQLQQFAAKE